MPKSEFKRKEKKLTESLLHINDIRLNQSERKKEKNPAVSQRTIDQAKKSKKKRKKKLSG